MYGRDETGPVTCGTVQPLVTTIADRVRAIRSDVPGDGPNADPSDPVNLMGVEIHACGPSLPDARISEATVIAAPSPVRPSRTLGRRRGAHPLAGGTSLRLSSWLGHEGCRGGSEVMTEDSDFKQIIRDRAAKTGESYQTA